ncbi:MAG: hypothetical protein ACFCU3_06090 [Verrucomicrobiales bacterium]
MSLKDFQERLARAYLKARLLENVGVAFLFDCGLYDIRLGLTLLL